MFQARRIPNRIHASRSGFTLLELFLALAVIVALSAMLLPNVFSILGNRSLVRGADGLRNVMVEARVEAMKSGRAQLLRVEIGGGSFAVQPMQSLTDVTEAADQFGQGIAAATGGVPVADMSMQTPVAPTAADTSQNTMLSDNLEQDRLPDGVVFGAVQVIANARSLTMQQSGVVTGGDGWSEPIIFYPDGTTSNVLVTITSEQDGQVIIRMRGLTGETRISEVMP